ncbi:hypothetical protein STRIP9103_06267, partial [Streptomyces ipomoeae 91-03]
MSQSRGPL